MAEAIEPVGCAIPTAVCAGLRLLPFSGQPHAGRSEDGHALSTAIRMLWMEGPEVTKICGYPQGDSSEPESYLVIP